MLIETLTRGRSTRVRFYVVCILRITCIFLFVLNVENIKKIVFLLVLLVEILLVGCLIVVDISTCFLHCTHFASTTTLNLLIFAQFSHHTLTLTHTHTHTHTPTFHHILTCTHSSILHWIVQVLFALLKSW